MAFEGIVQNLLDAQAHISEQGAEGTGRVRCRRVAYEYLESLGVLLDEAQQGERRTFDDSSGVIAACAEGIVQCAGQGLHLPVHHHGIEAFLAAEVFVYYRFAHFGAGGDFFDAYRLEAFGSE